MALLTACAAHDDEARATEERGTTQMSTASVSEEEVAQVRIARWHSWNQLAMDRPDGYVLSAELLHWQSDRAFAVFTVVNGHKAIQSVVGHVPIGTELTGRGPASAEAIALGEPPPKEPPPPGITATGSDLLTAAFGEGTYTGAASNASRQGSFPEGTDPEASKEQVDRVRAARWHAWELTASTRPDGFVLSVELLQSRPGETVAVFTVVKDRRPVQNIVRKNAMESDLVPAKGVALPNIIALGEPPPKQDPPPGITALGQSMLTRVFSAN